jgi:hypothetical protein
MSETSDQYEDRIERTLVNGGMRARPAAELARELRLMKDRIDELTDDVHNHRYDTHG